MEYVYLSVQESTPPYTNRLLVQQVPIRQIVHVRSRISDAQVYGKSLASVNHSLEEPLSQMDIQTPPQRVDHHSRTQPMFV